MAVDATVGDLRTRGAVPEGVDAVCRTVDDPVMADARSGSYGGGVIRVLYPLKRTTGQEAYWHDITAHEAGHAWDARYLTTTQRARYAQVRGLPTFNGEDYADTFAALAGGATYLGYIGSPPPPEQVAAICAERLVPC